MPGVNPLLLFILATVGVGRHQGQIVPPFDLLLGDPVIHPFHDSDKGNGTPGRELVLLLGNVP